MSIVVDDGFSRRGPRTLDVHSFTYDNKHNHDPYQKSMFRRGPDGAVGEQYLCEIGSRTLVSGVGRAYLSGWRGILNKC